MKELGPMGEQILISAGIFLLFIGIAWLVRAVITRWITRLVSKTATTLDDRIIALIRKPVFYIIILYGLDYAINRLPLHNRVMSVIHDVLFVVGVALVAYVVHGVLSNLIGWYGERIEGKEASRTLVREFIPLTQRIGSIFIFTIAVITVFKYFNYDVWSLITALGVGSLAIGLAAKETLTNIISGFSIMLDRPFRQGDRIKLANGDIGDVQEIGMRSTQIKTFDNTILVVPNTTLVNASLVNYCYPDFKVMARVRVGIAYGSDVGRAKEIMLAIAKEVPDILKDPPPSVYFTEFGDFSLNLLMIFWVGEYTRMLDAKDSVNTMIHERFARDGIEIPFPIQSVFLKK